MKSNQSKSPSASWPRIAVAACLMLPVFTAPAQTISSAPAYTNADVVSTNTLTHSGSAYQHFCADDYTWAAADASYFYYAWCDRSDTCAIPWSTNTYTRADPNIRLGKIRQ